MTNPNNAVGTNGAYGGRTSVNAFNDIMAVLSRGIVSGWGCVPSVGLTVSLGGASGTRDVAVAQDGAGNKTSVNNISGAPVDVTLPAAPSANSRIDAIVAYVENPPNGTTTDIDNPAACGIIPVSGSVAAAPSAPTESTIRAAITADGGSGSTAYYAVLATVTVAAGATDVTSDAIAAGPRASIASSNMDWATFRTGQQIFGLADARNTAYLDVGGTSGWYGYNFSTQGTIAGACTYRGGSANSGAMGGGVILTEDAPTGLYLISANINATAEAGSDGYRQYRILNNSAAITGDIAVPYRGGGGSTVAVTKLSPGDIVNLQINRSGAGRECRARVWLDGFYVAPVQE